MDDKKRNTEVIEETVPEVLRIVVVSDSPFIGLSLAEKLAEKKVEVIYIPNSNLKIQRQKRNFLVARKLPNSFDYLFQIDNQNIKDEKFSLRHCLQVCITHKAKFLFATDDKSKYSKKFFYNCTRNQKLDWRLVIFNYIFGPDKKYQSVIQQLFKEVSVNKIPVFPNAEHRVYPLFIYDFIEGLLRAMFSRDTEKQSFYLTGKEKISLHEFALKIKEVGGEKFKFLEEEKPVSDTWVIGSLLLEKIKKSWWQLVYQPKTSLEEAVKISINSLINNKSKKLIIKPKFPRFKIPSFSFLKPKAKEVKENYSKAQEIEESFSVEEKKSIKLNLVQIFLGILFILLLALTPVVLFAGTTYLGIFNLKKTIQEIKEENFSALDVNLAKSKKYFTLSQQILQQMSFVFSFTGLNNSAQNVEEYLGIGIGLTESIEGGVRALENAKIFSDIVFKSKIADPREELDNLLVELGQAEDNLAFVETRIERIKENKLLEKILPKQMEGYKEKVSETRKKISFARDLLSLAPEFLGFSGRKKYLLLLQNNMELRPTGGFIGSFAVITFEKGRLLDFNIEDVYNADGQLKGHVEPPPALKEYLGEAGWYLRDSNFSPDFPTSADQAEWFLEKEIGQTVDGTIGINLNFIKSLLLVTGPVQLPEYNETINADNLFERAEYHSEIDFFPGSTQKKSFLTVLANFLFEKIKHLPPQSSLNLFAEWQKNLQSKDVMLSFNDKKLQKKVNILGWGGEIKDIKFGTASQFQGSGLIDYLMIVDANLGVNKANYFITRNIDFEATITDSGEIINNLTINYQNTSKSETWPGGTYKNYLRIIVPRDVDKIIIKEKNAKNGTYKTVLRNKIDETRDFNKKIFGYLTQVKPMESKKIQVIYQRSNKFPMKEKIGDYVLYFQKQSGTKKDSLHVAINYPQILKPIKIMPKADWHKQSISFNSFLDKDKFFAVEFSR